MQRKGLMAGASGALFTLAFASMAAAAPLRIERLCGPPGMQMGMSVESWKELGFPGAGPGVVQPICSDDTAAANYLGVKAATAPGDPLVCGYANRIGSVFLDDTINILDGYPAQGLRYHFQAGRLTQIDCVASDNAFDGLQARFDKLYGTSKAMVRDHVHTEIGLRPRVKERWSIPGGSLTLIDPVQPATDLSLEYRANGG